jgi:hypothetical protein
VSLASGAKDGCTFGVGESSGLQPGTKPGASFETQLEGRFHSFSGRSRVAATVAILSDLGEDLRWNAAFTWRGRIRIHRKSLYSEKALRTSGT